MRPEFALSLSFDGITLLHRAAGGWLCVGDVPLDADDMRADLAALRKRALAIATGELACKIILPNEQIRYMSIGTGHFEGEAREAMVRQALDGSTPYAVDDLVFDISTEGDVTHVAAVAIETLEEAQAFALEHDFNPVSFVAMPDSGAFVGEPWFGPSGQVDPGTEIEPDAMSVVVIGDAPLPTPAPAAPTEVQEPAATFRRRDSAAPADEPTVHRIKEERARITLMPEPDPLLADQVAQLNEQAEAASGVGAASVTAPVLDIPDNDTPEPTPKSGVSGITGFFSRRSSPSPTPARRMPSVEAAAGPVELELPDRQVPKDEAGRMTVFGARAGDPVGGKPRHLGLILTAALLLFLAAVAAWASLFLEDGVAGLFRDRAPATEITERAPAPAPRAPQVQDSSPGSLDAPPQTGVVEDPVLQALEPRPQQVPPSAPPRLSDTDIAILDALREAPEPAAPPVPEAEISETPVRSDTSADPRTRYAATGIWPNAPQAPRTPAIIGLDDLISTSIDRTDLSQDAVALPAEPNLETDALPNLPSAPVAAGTEFALDERGFVTPTAEGALTPDGILVFAGLPPLRPTRFPDRGSQQAQAEEIETEAIRTRLAALRPRGRPENLAEQIERSQLGGLTRDEISASRPRARPLSLQQEAERVAAAEAGDDTIQTASAQAIERSLRPDARPGDFSDQVAQAIAAAAANAPSTTGGVTAASTAAIASTVAAVQAPRVVTPNIPSSASVARQATLNNAINLRRVNLIGVFGTPSNRRALVRLPSGRYKKVKVGDRVDGGRIVGIGDSELRYQKGGRNVTLKIPSG